MLQYGGCFFVYKKRNLLPLIGMRFPGITNVSVFKIMLNHCISELSIMKGIDASIIIIKT
jgi:hypothetical protein